MPPTFAEMPTRVSRVEILRMSKETSVSKRSLKTSTTVLWPSSCLWGSSLNVVLILRSSSGPPSCKRAQASSFLVASVAALMMLEGKVSKEARRISITYICWLKRLNNLKVFALKRKRKEILTSFQSVSYSRR